MSSTQQKGQPSHLERARSALKLRDFETAERHARACLIEQPEFAGKLGLVISGNQSPGIGGPVFVAELHTRKPDLPVLVLGAKGAVPSDYKDERVVFLPRPVTREKILAVTGQLLADQRNAVA